MFPVIVFSQKTMLDSNAKLDALKTKHDTVIIIRESANESTSKNYQEILEKTNNQLSLWTNPYGVLIGIVGLFVALLAIAVAFVIYKQGKDAKDLIKESLTKHEIALGNLINEKNQSLKNYEVVLNEHIAEYQKKLASQVGDEQKQQITDIITRLEEQKVQLGLRRYNHSGWAEKDIAENYSIGRNTIFSASILLNEIHQKFVIYLRVVASDGKRYWLGFSGGVKDAIGKDKSEFTQHRIYDSKEVLIRENIFSVFKSGFSELSSYPIRVDNVRLRTSDVNLEDITFLYKVD